MSEAAGPSEGVRRSLEASRDPRVARTRAAIAAAVHNLSESGSDVSVAAISRVAGISRASFYTHFADLDELAHSMTREAFAHINELWKHESSQPAHAMRLAQRRLVDHYLENRGLHTAVAALPVSKGAYLANVRAMASQIERAIATHPNRPAELAVEPTARYIAGAAFGLIDAWLTSDIDLDDTELVDHLTQLLPSWFSGLD